MLTKAERTREHILKQVSAVFNKHGYYGTSLAQITTAIGLTKGAVYGHFKDKEELAVEAFNYNLRQVIFPLSDRINEKTSAQEKLFAITEFYRSYYKEVLPNGGCPILNVGIDSSNVNPELSKRVRHVMERLIDQLADIIQMGIDNKEFVHTLQPKIQANRIYSMIEGGIFSATLLNNEEHVLTMVDYIDSMIETEMLRKIKP